MPAAPACPQARAAAEVRERLGGAAPSAANAASLQYLEAVVLEALRLRPPAYLVGRCAARDVELGPYSLTAGAAPVSWGRGRSSHRGGAGVGAVRVHAARGGRIVDRAQRLQTAVEPEPCGLPRSAVVQELVHHAAAPWLSFCCMRAQARRCW